jgi:hypothetical protein
MSQERVDSLFASESWNAVYTAFTDVSLKAYDFDTIREALLVYIRQTYPDKYNDFIASSEFIAILDLVSYLGHSLSYRLDMNTRENFLSLAERKESILRIAKSMGYNKTRPINGRGFMKITSIRTDEDVFDSNGVSLANRTVNWNDSNDPDWYENFITVINSSLDKNTKIQNPKQTINISNVEHSLYDINENSASKSVVYGFKSNIAGKSRNVEAVRAGFEDNVVVELAPDRTKNFTIINRNDNLGPASDRTGFFVFAKLGKLSSKVFNYTVDISNRVQTIADNNISNSDVWVQKTNTNGEILRNVTKVDNDSRETAIYNSLRNGTGDLVSVNTTVDNGIELHYPDGIFGNSAYGNYRVWYRVSDNESYSVDSKSISNVNITIPYIGNDGVAHSLNITLSSTRDFGENYAAENFLSVRRIAPRSYYAQDRMVNGQDYNVLPLSLGANVVKKIKAVNTNFSGNSRYFEMDDVTGHHSNVTVNSTDGTLYLDNDSITAKLSFNRQNGNIVNFIRNEISKVIKHNSLANLYYINNIGDKKVVINADTDELFTEINVEIDPTDPKTIEIQTIAQGESGADPHPSEILYPGDFIKIKTDNNEYWTRIYGAAGSGGGISNNRYTITDILPEDTRNDNLFTIVEIVKGFRTRFEDFEIIEIRNGAFSEGAASSFDIIYDYDEVQNRWIWKLHDKDTDPELVAGEDIYVNLSYKKGIRTAEAEYTVKFSGKKVVFESDGDVKFFYSNNKRVVDLETNLAHQDRIVIDYYQPGDSDIIGGDEKDDVVVLGYSDIYNYSLDGINASFNIQYKTWTGAPRNLEFIQDELNGMRQPENAMNFVLVNTNGDDIPEAISGLNEAIPNTGYDTPIGNRTNDEYTLPVTIDVSEITIDNVSDPVTNEAPTLETDKYEVSSVLTVVAEDGNVANADSTLVSLSTLDFDLDGFKGNVSTDYFTSARDTANFVFVKSTELPTGETLSSITIDDVNNLPSGVVNDYMTFKTDPTSTVYQFQFSNSTISAGTGSVFWKQFAYAEIEFDSERELTENTIVVKVDGARIDKRHIELLETDTTDDTVYSYKIVFWTHDPENALIDVYDIYTTASGISIEDYKVRAQSAVKITRATKLSIPEYSSIGSYIYEQYIDTEGYADYSKVKLTTMDDKQNPYGMIDVIGTDRYIIIAKLPDSSTYNISKFAYATNIPENITEQYYVYYNIEQDKWYNNLGLAIAQGSKEITLDSDQGVFPAGTKFKVVDGISHINNTLARYNWEHFADKDKRIDPSTSNIVDVYVLTADYARKIDTWKNSGFSGPMPKAPNNYELKKLMESIKGKEMISDHVSYIPVKFKPLFGTQAIQENQAVFKVVKKSGTLFTDSEIKSAVSAAVNEYFKIENWDFGDTFYFSELAAHIHKSVPDYISSVVITPKYSGNQFTKLLSISSDQSEIFMSVTTSADVKIIERITDTELSGE